MLPLGREANAYTRLMSASLLRRETEPVSATMLSSQKMLLETVSGPSHHGADSLL